MKESYTTPGIEPRTYYIENRRILYLVLFIFNVAIQISIVFHAYVTVPSAMKTAAGEDRGNLGGNKDKYI